MWLFQSYFPSHVILHVIVHVIARVIAHVVARVIVYVNHTALKCDYINNHTSDSECDYWQ